MTTKSDITNIPTAVFIDGPWLFWASKRIGIRIDYKILFNNLVRVFGTKTKIYFYGTIDPTSSQQQKFYLLLAKAGYIVHYKKIKKLENKIISNSNSLDIDLVLNAIQISPSLKRFVLISGDGDFANLIQQIKQTGINTCVISLPFSIGYYLRQVANTFINLEYLMVEHRDINKLSIFKKQKVVSKKKRKKKEKIVTPNNLYIKSGENFKSYIHIKKLIQSARSNITIVDPYVDEQILAMTALLKREVNVVILTNKTSPADFSVQLQKLRDDGRQIKVYKQKLIHDRFLEIDNNLWHSGHSFKDLGERDSMLNKICEKKIIDEINNRISKVIENSKEI